MDGHLLAVSVAAVSSVTVAVGTTLLPLHHRSESKWIGRFLTLGGAFLFADVLTHQLPAFLHGWGVFWVGVGILLAVLSDESLDLIVQTVLKRQCSSQARVAIANLVVDAIHNGKANAD